MERIDIKEILTRVQAGTGSAEDERIAAYWLNELKKNELSNFSKEDLDTVANDMWMKIVQQTVTTPVNPVRLWQRIGAVAAALTVLGLFVYLFKFSSNNSGTQDSAYVQDIKPGVIGATLTLANGKTIRLADAASGKLAAESGVTISKTQDGALIYEITDQQKADANKINTLSTSNGETYRLRLPDGSLIWLNAASTLKYPASFAALKNRRVELQGEAYLEVAKDKSHPFIVDGGGQQVEVLGTHFNVNAYADEPSVKTTLLEGSVRINGDVVLRPNEQAMSDATGIKVHQVLAEIFTDWKDGAFNFKNEDLPSIMRKVSRWYDAEVIYQVTPEKRTYSGYVSRAENVSTVLTVLSKMSGHQFKVQDQKIIVIK